MAQMDSEIIVKAEPIGFAFASLASPGMRKVAVIGGSLAFVLLSAALLLAFGQLSEAGYIDLTYKAIQWGGGYFVGGNVLEHGAKLLAPKAGGQ